MNSVVNSIGMRRLHMVSKGDSRGVLLNSRRPKEVLS